MVSKIGTLVESFAIDLAFALIGVLILKLVCYLSRASTLGPIAWFSNIILSRGGD